MKTTFEILTEIETEIKSVVAAHKSDADSAEETSAKMEYTSKQLGAMDALIIVKEKILIFMRDL